MTHPQSWFSLQGGPSKKYVLHLSINSHFCKFIVFKDLSGSCTLIVKLVPGREMERERHASLSLTRFKKESQQGCIAAGGGHAPFQTSSFVRN